MRGEEEPAKERRLPTTISRERLWEVVREEAGEEWDDDVLAAARFKAFSGQRSDWEPRFLYWRSLLISVARRLGLFALPSSQVRQVWFCRGAISPLCLEQVLHEMHVSGDIILKSDLIDPTSGSLHQLLRRLSQMVGRSTASILNEELLVVQPLLREKTADIVKRLVETHWTSTCVLPLEKFRSFFNGSEESLIALSYLCHYGKGHYISIRKDDFIEGIKLSLVEAPCPYPSTLDSTLLNLIWTVDKLQHKLSVIDDRWTESRKMALASYKLGNKQASYRHIRQSKVYSESRVSCSSMLDKVEEVIGLFENADSAKEAWKSV